MNKKTAIITNAMVKAMAANMIKGAQGCILLYLATPSTSFFPSGERDTSQSGPTPSGASTYSWSTRAASSSRNFTRAGGNFSPYNSLTRIFPGASGICLNRSYCSVSMLGMVILLADQVGSIVAQFAPHPMYVL